MEESEETRVPSKVPSLHCHSRETGCTGYGRAGTLWLLHPHPLVHSFKIYMPGICKVLASETAPSSTELPISWEKILRQARVRCPPLQTEGGGGALQMLRRRVAPGPTNENPDCS